MANWQIQIKISGLHNVQNCSDSHSCLAKGCFCRNLTLANVLWGKNRILTKVFYKSFGVGRSTKRLKTSALVMTDSWTTEGLLTCQEWKNSFTTAVQPITCNILTQLQYSGTYITAKANEAWGHRFILDGESLDLSSKLIIASPRWMVDSCPVWRK